MTPRMARIGDAAAIAAIYNEGIADRIATFETEPRSAEQIARWFDDRHPIVVVEADDGPVLAFAASAAYRDRPAMPVLRNSRSTLPVDIVAPEPGASPWGP